LDKIDGSPGLPLNNLIGQGQAQSVAKNPISTASSERNDSTESVSAAKDRLTIDGTTQALRQAEATLNNDPPIDNDKVAQIRQAIAEGSYKVDPGRIADSFLAMEQSLFEK